MKAQIWPYLICPACKEPMIVVKVTDKSIIVQGEVIESYASCSNGTCNLYNRRYLLPTVELEEI